MSDNLQTTYHLQTPWDFDTKWNIGDNEIVYNGLHEICQGGPAVGTLSINGKQVAGYLYGGPFLFYDKIFYIPCYVKKFMGWGFQLAKISLEDLNVQLIGKIENLIFLDKIENGVIYYFENMDKIEYKFIEL